MSSPNVLIYLLRKDLRVSDNPILHHLATASDHGFTHLLPVFVFPAHQIEISGFIRDGSKSPYPEARSQTGNYWRCGPHRAKFIGEAVWNLKESLESLGSGLVLRAGKHGEVLQQLLEGLKSKDHKVGAVWMVGEESVEERREQSEVAAVCEKHSAEFRLWTDEKYFVDDRDLSLADIADLPDVFTTYRKSTEPLRQKPRATLPKPEKHSLLPFPEDSHIPAQASPFTTPDSLERLLEALVNPVKNFIPDLPAYPESGTSAHPFKGGEDPALERLEYLIRKGVMSAYKDTRNGLLGTDFSSKLSAFLAQGCLTARQIHEALVKFEDGTDAKWEDVEGYGKGENEGTKAIRFELLWRDYMRLCTRKFKHKLFRREGFRGDGDYGNEKKRQWKSASPDGTLPNQNPSPEGVARILERFAAGTTGMGLIDASQRELIHTGYTSNRARQNVASFLSKHLGIDWRYGAEYYEMLLVDYDVSSNWANWQYVAGVGNDPRGEARIFNPVKQGFDYDAEGRYVRAWVPEVAPLEKLENVLQAWTASPEDLAKAGLADSVMVTDPVKRINFSVEGKPRPSRRPFVRRRGNNGGGRGGGGGGAGAGAGGNGRIRGSASSGTNNDASNGNASSDQSATSGNESGPSGPGAMARHNNHQDRHHNGGRGGGGGQLSARTNSIQGSFRPPEGPRGGFYRGNGRGGGGIGTGSSGGGPHGRGFGPGRGGGVGNGGYNRGLEPYYTLPPPMHYLAQYPHPHPHPHHLHPHMAPPPHMHHQQPHQQFHQPQLAPPKHQHQHQHWAPPNPQPPPPPHAGGPP